MYRTDASGNTNSLPTPASLGTPGYYTDGNAGSGTPATVVEADHLNAMQEEIAGPVLAAGLTLSKTNQAQLLSAIKYFSNSAIVQTVSSANLTVLTTDLYQTILVTTGASDRTITLPAAASSTNRKLKIKKVDSGAGKVIVDANASETIDGALTFNVFFQYNDVEIVCDGTSWYVLSASIDTIETAYTPVIVGCGTVTSNTGFWSRHKDKIRVNGSFKLGSVTGANATISLPTFANTIDTTKLPATQSAILGYLYRATSGSNNIPSVSTGALAISFQSGDLTTVFPSTSTISSTGFVQATGTLIGVSGDLVSYLFEVPVTQFA